MGTIAVLVPLLWLGWLALIDWVPLFPLNDLRADNVRERRVAALANYPVPVLIAAGVAVGQGWSLLAALALSALCVVGHVVSWWLPYFGLGTAGQRETYAREYARTWKVLPTAGHAVVIDVQHLVVGALTLAMLGTTLAATLAR
jgi:hypothetical protein